VLVPPAQGSRQRSRPRPPQPPQAGGGTAGRRLGSEEEDRARAARRARGQIRRYAVANRLRYLWTFTYAGEGQHDRRQVVADWAAFVRRAQAAGIRLAWVRALELHPGGHGYHVHAAIAERVDHARMASLWGHGFVQYSERPRRGVSQREGYRRTARYIAKYVGKDADLTPPGTHAYEVAQGYAPEVVHVEHSTAEALIDLATRMLGQPTYVWSSSGDPEWCGPPAAYVSC